MTHKAVVYGLNVFLLLLTISLLSACQRQNSFLLPGYIEGRYTYISPNYSGVLKTLNVNRGDEVKSGQLLYTLVPEPEYDDLIAAQNKVEQDLAQEQQSQSDFDLQKTVLARRVALLKQKFITQEEVDTSQTRYNDAFANLSAQKDNLAMAQADLRKASWVAKQKTAYAPISGLVFDTYFTPGELVENGTPVLSLLDPSQIRIYFYTPENLLNQFKLNQIIEISCDSCVKPIKGRIVYISPQSEYTPPVIYSNEDRHRLVYRIEAKPLLDKAYEVLHPGQPITVNTTVQERGSNE